MDLIIRRQTIGVGLLLLMTMKKGYSLHCYQCDSEAHSGCVVTPKPEALGEYLIDCAGISNITQCVKTVGAANKVIRGCSTVVSAESKCTSDRGLIVCTCDVDSCNSSQRTGSRFVINLLCVSLFGSGWSFIRREIW